MNLLSKLNSNIINTPYKVSMLLLYVFSFVLPISQKISTIVLLVLLFFSILSFFIDKSRNVLLAYLFPTLLYILIVISVFKSKNFETNYLEQRAAFIGMPFIFLTLKINNKRFKKLLEYFVYGCIVALIICFINAFNNSFQYIDEKWVFQPVVNKEFSFFYSVVRDGNYFFSTFFSILHDSTYMAIYFNFATTIILSFSLWKKTKVYYIFLFFLGIAVFQLSSKISIMTLFFIYSVYMIYSIKSKSLKLILVGSTIVFGSLFLFQNPRGKVMIQTFKKEGLTFSPNERFGYALRLMSWDAALELIKEHPIFGVGVNNAQKELNNKYLSKNYTSPLRENLNAHNQYLQLFIEIGILGTTLIILMQIALIKTLSFNNLYSHIFLITMFLLIVNLSFLFESMFNRYSGISFFMFVYCLIANNNAQTRRI